jgi:hypothetical protein
MSATMVRTYITQDFDEKDKNSYLAYIKGDEKSTRWIQKALLRREPLLLLELKCNIKTPDGSLCNGWIDIKETGICKCSYSHYCYEPVIKAIDIIQTRAIQYKNLL